jgi:hypothetical protein
MFDLKSMVSDLISRDGKDFKGLGPIAALSLPG